MKKTYSFEDLRNIISELRSPRGCTWDRAQTHESICPCMIEEAYEAVDGVRLLAESGETGALKEELGDVLLQVLFHCQIAEEEGEFTLSDVICAEAEKMVHRHPHVFPDEKGRRVPEEEVDWEALKREEKGEMSPSEEIDRIPHQLPALVRSAKVLKKLERYCEVGADAEKSGRTAALLLEDFRNLPETEREEEREEELLGDLLLQLVNLGRKRGLNSEQALTRALERQLQRAVYPEK